MKTFSLGLVAALLLTLGALALSERTSAASLSCGPLRNTCDDRSQPVCTDNQWHCVTKTTRHTTVSRSSASSDAVCGPNNIRCMGGFTPVCANNTWSCQFNGAPETCIAQCPDGYQYRTCSEDGSPINYFADPCMNHSDSSSSVSSCGANNVRCMEGYTPTCSNSAWSCVQSHMSSSRSSRSSMSNVHITSMTPSMPSVRGMVTIEGSGFARRGNVVLFGDSVIPNVRSLDGKHLTFRVPTRTMRACYFMFSKLMTKCLMPTHQYSSGDYDVSVRVKGDISNQMTLTLR